MDDKKQDTKKTYKQIRVSEDVYRVLQKEARGLIDSPDTVLRRLLKIDEAVEQTTTEAARASHD